MPKCHFDIFQKSKMAATTETSIAIISETVDRRAKRSSISAPWGNTQFPKCHGDVSHENPLLLLTKLWLQIYRKPSIVEQNGAQFRHPGAICNFVDAQNVFRYFSHEIPYCHSPKITILDISETIDLRVKRSLYYCIDAILEWSPWYLHYRSLEILILELYCW